MALGTQALLVAQNEAVPIAVVLANVIDLNRCCDAPSGLTDPAQRLLQELLPPDRMPNRHRIPRPPMAFIWIGARTNHNSSALAYSDESSIALNRHHHVLPLAQKERSVSLCNGPDSCPDSSFSYTRELSGLVSGPSH
jgi:hypothetical protein